MASRSATDIVDFEHKPLPGSQWIRLLKIQSELENGCISCRLDHFEPKTCPGYTALSYEWGDATPRHNICINGRHRRIHENLWRFLRRSFLAGFAGYLWTDLLCLDQTNAEELAIQIARMADIYESAEEVAIWLGDDPSLEQELQSGIYRMAAKLSYWNRVWIIQEIAFARKLTVIYGSCEVDWVKFDRPVMPWIVHAHVQNTLREPDSTYHNFKGLGMPDNYYDFMKYFNELGKWRERVQMGFEGPVTFSKIVLPFLSSQSTKNRDAAYALVSLAIRLCPSWNPKDLAINYQKPDYLVFWDLVFELDDGDISLADDSRLNYLRNRIVGQGESLTWNAHSELELYICDDTTSATHKRLAKLALWFMKKKTALEWYLPKPRRPCGGVNADRRQGAPIFRLQRAVQLVHRHSKFRHCPSTPQDFFLSWRCDLQKAEHVRRARQAVAETSNIVDDNFKSRHDEDQSSSHFSESRFNCLHSNSEYCPLLVLDIPEAQMSVCLDTRNGDVLHERRL